MRLVLDLDGVRTEIGIEGYMPDLSLNINGEIGYCMTYFDLSSDYINYTINVPILRSSEVEYLKFELKNILEDKTKEEKEIAFANPTIMFNLQPSGDIVTNTENGEYLTCDCSGEMIIAILREGRLSSNEFRLFMVKDELRALYDYLRVVTHEIPVDDDLVYEYKKEGVFIL